MPRGRARRLPHAERLFAAGGVQAPERAMPRSLWRDLVEPIVSVAAIALVLVLIVAGLFGFD